MTDEQKASCRAIAQHYGFNNQRHILTEECAELIQAVSKIDRAKNSTELSKAYDKFFEEIADVLIMIEQMFGCDKDVETVNGFINQKLDRQMKRMMNGE